MKQIIQANLQGSAEYDKQQTGIAFSALDALVMCGKLLT